MKRETYVRKSRIPTHSAKETQKFAQEFAKKILERQSKSKGALVIALQGELGSGKTTFVRGFARGLGIKEKVLSPTFLLIKKYRFHVPGFKFHALWHIDCYRVENEQELVDLGWDNIVSDPRNIVLLEWPERVQNILPQDTIAIHFEATRENERTITFTES